MKSPSTNCHSEGRRGIYIFFPHLLFFLILLVILPHSTLAHSQPLKLEPAPGATLFQPPPEIRLTFSEPVQPNASIGLIPQGSFTPLTDITAQQDPGNPSQIFAPLPRLMRGTYTVQWQIQSSDGHPLTGSYSFAVGISSGAVIWRLTLFFSLFALLLAVARRTLKKVRTRPVSASKMRVDNNGRFSNNTVYNCILTPTGRSMWTRN